METVHHLHVADARDLEIVPANSVELIVTSPPYPMIDLWDETFSALDPDIGDDLREGNGDRAFERMHDLLDAVWEELPRILVPGGICCINIGDATRSIGGSFRQYPNHARIITSLQRNGFVALPDILWRKPTNSGTKFMGSGMLPPSAYVTLEHEYVLVFRNGPKRREFPPKDPQRYEAAYFWEERNEWFSDLWTDVRGVSQAIGDTTSRERAGAFPLEVPARLINMFSVYGDTVLDPFVGTGTTTLAAMTAARDSIGVDREAGLIAGIDDRIDDVPTLATARAEQRLRDHRSFVNQHDGSLEYEAHQYDFPVMTAQERAMQLYTVDDITARETCYTVTHRPIESASNDD